MLSLAPIRHHGKEIHLIVDNLSVHKHQKVKDGLSEHPNYFLHFTPTHASLLNQIELWFSIYARKITKRVVFRSKEDMVAKIIEYIGLYDKNAKPFRWIIKETPLTV
ncbi:MAG: putative transposase [Candidatus Brocadia sinica]|nr:MAG: putative transposase [Candidatus Brocadia sinica]MCK6467729.1 transposase [Candidatus Brocadia sinica]